MHGRFPMQYRASRRRSAADLAFMFLVTLVAVGMIVLTLVLGVAPGIDPDQALSIFAAP
jgi:hypothetical protein